MEIKETTAMTVLCERHTTTIRQVRHISQHVTARIDDELSRCGLEFAGPWVFIARNLPKDSKTSFDITFCRPAVSIAGYDGPYEVLALEPIIVASTMYQGPLRGLFTQGYAPLVRDIELSRHAFSGESREIYHRWAGPTARYQQIEIQFGLAY